MTNEEKGIIRKLIASETRIVQLEKENERLKADMEWISTKDNPPKDGQDVLAYQVKPDWEGNILLIWNSASFTYIEYPYYMLEPKPPKQLFNYLKRP